MNNKVKIAFTLAETLITLAIIGIVAALTMPALIQRYQEKVTVTKLKKMYNTLTNAHSYILYENNYNVQWLNIFDEAGAIDTYEKFKPYLKVIKDCNTQKSGCFPTDYTKKNGGYHTPYDSRYYKVILSDGSGIMFRAGGNNEQEFYADIFYDVNGEKAPNKWGHDLFEFLVIGDKLLPGGSLSGNVEESCLAPTGDGFACAKWVIEKGNMEYLHCDDLSWTGKQKCSD